MEIQNIELYKNFRNVELEFRVSVKQNQFEQCLKFLQENFEETVIHTIDLFDKNSNRKSIDTNLIIKKDNKFMSYLRFKDFSIKFCINIENPLEIKKFVTCFERKKERHKFIDKTLDYINYDLTIINNEFYEIEIEIDPIMSLYHTSEYIFDNSFKKLKTLLTCSDF